MNDLDLYDRTHREIVTTGTDPYAAYAAKFGGGGLFLSFKDNEFRYGQNKDVLPFGTQLVANMAGLKQGWKCWVNNQCIDDRTELVSSGIRHATRSELDRQDQDMWERNRENKPIDPWVMTHEIELVDIDSGQAYAFASGAKTYIRAIADVVGKWHAHRRMYPGQVPVIELSSNWYMHSDPKVGKTYVPVLKIVGWTDEDNPSLADAADGGSGQAEEELPFERDQEPAAKPAAPQRQAATKPTRF